MFKVAFNVAREMALDVCSPRAEIRSCMFQTLLKGKKKKKLSSGIVNYYARHLGSS